jgi:hypothetical protein
MKEKNADFFIGKAAICTPHHQAELSKMAGRLVFSRLNRPEAIWRCLTGPNSFFEPASAWVIKNRISKKIGYWAAPDSIPTTPLMNWIQRAALKKAKFCFSEKVTTLKFNVHNPPNIQNNIKNEIPIYFAGDPFIEMVEPFTLVESDIIREWIKHDIEESVNNRTTTKVQLWDKPLDTPDELELRDKFLQFINSIGIIELDLTHTSDFAKQSLSTITKRTGEKLENLPPPGFVINELMKIYKY